MVITSVLVLLAASRAVTVMTLDPVLRATEALHDVVPLAVPLRPFRLLVQLTCVTPTLSEADPRIVTEDEFVVNVAALVGEVIVTTGAVVSGVFRVTVKVSVDVLPAASRAVTVMTLEPV